MRWEEKLTAMMSELRKDVKFRNLCRMSTLFKGRDGADDDETG